MIFDGQNPIIENLLSEVVIGKKTKNSIDKVIEKAPSFKDIEIKSNLEKFRLFNGNFSGRKDDSGDDNDNDDNDNDTDNNNSRVAKAPINLLELPDILKQDLTGMAKNKEPETEK